MHTASRRVHGESCHDLQLILLPSRLLSVLDPSAQVPAAVGVMCSGGRRETSGISSGSWPQQRVHSERKVGSVAICSHFYCLSAWFEPGTRVQQHAMAATMGRALCRKPSDSWRLAPASHGRSSIASAWQVLLQTAPVSTHALAASDLSTEFIRFVPQEGHALCMERSNAWHRQQCTYSHVSKARTGWVVAPCALVPTRIELALGLRIECSTFSPAAFGVTTSFRAQACSERRVRPSTMCPQFYCLSGCFEPTDARHRVPHATGPMRYAFG